MNLSEVLYRYRGNHEHSRLKQWRLDRIFKALQN